MWVIHHCLRSVNGTAFTCRSRHKDLSPVHVAQLCRATQSFPSQLCFPRMHSRRVCGSISQRGKTDLSPWKGSSNVYFDGLARIPGWSQQMTYSTWESNHNPVQSPHDFSTLKISAALWGRASQLASTASTGCTIPVGSALSLPLSLPTFRAQLLHSSGHRLLFCCTTGAHQGYIHIQKLLCSHFTAWKLNIFFLKEHPPLLTPTTATAVILALRFLQGCFLPESPFPGSILSRQSALFKQRLTFDDLPKRCQEGPMAAEIKMTAGTTYPAASLLESTVQRIALANLTLFHLGRSVRLYTEVLLTETDTSRAKRDADQTNSVQ